MKTSYAVAVSMFIGAAIGAAAMGGVNAQVSKSKVYFISESEVLDRAAVTAYEAKLAPVIKAAGDSRTPR